MYPLDGAASLLKSVSERFEKSKKMRANVKNLKPGEDGESSANQGFEYLHQYRKLTLIVAPFSYF